MDPGRCESAAEVEGSEIYSPSPGAASVLRWQMSLHINQQTQHPQNQKPEMNWTAQKTLRTLCKRHKLKMNEQMHNQTIMSWRKNKKKSESIFGSIKNWKRRRQSVDHALSPSMHFRFPASRYAAVEWLVRKKKWCDVLVGNLDCATGNPKLAVCVRGSGENDWVRKNSSD